VDEMTKNIGTADRLLRLLIAILLFALAWWQSSWIALGFGIFTLYEALASWCVMYALLGKSSCKIKKQ
jgi:hypothetical protein